MIVIVGASASGKTEIANKLVKNHHYYKCITTTTRPLREGEVDGISYHFLTKEQFNGLLLQNSFIEVITYQNNFYGTQKKDLKENSIIILDPNGANAIIEYLQDQAFVVLIESRKGLRKERMLARGDKPEDIKIRLKNDDKLFSKRNLIKVDLHIKNKNEPLEDIAKYINNKYKDNKKSG